MNLRQQFDLPAPVILLAEGKLGETGAKTAHGVIAQSEIFEAQAIVDSSKKNQTADEVLARDDVGEIPILESVSQALDHVPNVEALVIGVAPAGGQLPSSWESQIVDAIESGCDVVSGMHTYLTNDSRWTSLADENGVELFDVRKPPNEDELRIADGRVDELDTDIVLTSGTDCSVGKRTTTYELYRAAVERGLDAGWVATGQTGIMTGAHAGVAIDGVPADFTAGVVEELVCQVGADHDIVFVEGQAALTHRAYAGVTTAVLHGAWPDAVVLADQPDRERRTHEQFAVAGIETETELIERLAETEVVALSTWGDPKEQERKHDLPAANVYHEQGPVKLLDALQEALPSIQPKSKTQ